MVATNLKQFKVHSYNELYAMYLDGELGVTEQRMPVIPKWKTGEDGTDTQLINRLLERDTDNLYQVTFMDFGILKNPKSYWLITILGIGFSKKFTEPVMEYEMHFGEDGVWETIYQVDAPTESRDGSRVGELSFYGTTENI